MERSAKIGKCGENAFGVGGIPTNPDVQVLGARTRPCAARACAPTTRNSTPRALNAANRSVVAGIEIWADGGVELSNRFMNRWIEERSKSSLGVIDENHTNGPEWILFRDTNFGRCSNEPSGKTCRRPEPPVRVDSDDAGRNQRKRGAETPRQCSANACGGEKCASAEQLEAPRVWLMSR
jgi:hypothetical protein